MIFMKKEGEESRSAWSARRLGAAVPTVTAARKELSKCLASLEMINDSRAAALAHVSCQNAATARVNVIARQLEMTLILRL